MIDIEKVKKEFDIYVMQFNTNDPKIKLKIDHIKRVANISHIIATKLGLDKEKKELAETIGFFHDIGRFKQVETYNTFSDRDSVNHAEYAIKVLFEDNLIEKFNIDEKYKKIIKLAIINHNKNQIDEGLNDNEMLFAKIIRDADKLDILYTICNYDFESIFWYKDFSCEKIGDIILNDFFNLRQINYQNIKSNADQIIMFYAYIYDMNFENSIEYLKSKKYLNTFAKRIEKYFTSQALLKQMNEVLEFTNNYLNYRQT